ncbi:MAG TPA: type I glutamate--ammonia ligase [Ktedonobacterales bacterium]|nr:type I glutamate--ammonia ligase [Ktedonobacterales bacterium]
MTRRPFDGGTTPTGVNQPEAALRVLEHVETHHIGFINLEFTDVVGTAKCVTIPAAQLASCLEHGKWFDGSAIEGFARVAETDMYLRPDLATFAAIPWHAGGEGAHDLVARVICDVLTPAGERFPGDPRAVLARQLGEAAALGYRFEVAAELEFFLLAEKSGRARAALPHDRGGYFDVSTDLAADVRREIVVALEAMGFVVEASHHEVAAGQHELDFAPADAVRAADAIITARYVAKAIAQRHGLWATFMPKPFYGINGSGLHVHQQLVATSDGRNVFSDAQDSRYGLTNGARQFIAGQLAHAAAMCAVLCPLVNSYKRLVPGYEAPAAINWGRVNREALIRVPRAAGGVPGGTRVELRCADPSCNPYLGLAVMLAAGLDGMRRELTGPPPVEESLYAMDDAARLARRVGALPATLGEALDALRGDEALRAALGGLVAEWFVEAKTQEWLEYGRQVHAWERERYLGMF